MTTKKKAVSNKNKLSEEDRRKGRIAIAKDVIAQIKAKRYIAESGCYFASEDATVSRSIDSLEPKDVQKALKNIKECTVCALGSLFVSKVSKFNNVDLKKISLYVDYKNTYNSLEDFIDSQTVMIQGLQDYFDKVQLSLIERCFEGYIEGISIDKATTVEIWASQYPEDEERLIAICKNIIENNGDFIPMVKVVPQY